MTDVSAYFAQIYADSSDPWQYEKRWYEVRKRAICLSLLPYPHFAKAIELGCSNGVFSEQKSEHLKANLRLKRWIAVWICPMCR